MKNNGMHQSRTNAPSRNTPVGNIPLRTVLALSGKETIRVGITQPPGVPDFAYKLICNAHNSRQSDASMGIPPTGRTIETLLRRLAASRAPYGCYSSDPLLWMLRVRWHIRQATLSSLGLQSGSYMDPPYSPEKWSTRHPTRYQAMASWAYRCWDYNETEHKIRVSLFNEGLVPTNYAFPDYSTGHRFFWYSAACGIHRTKASQIMHAAGVLPAWRKEISSRHVYSGDLQNSVYTSRGHS